MPSTLFFNLVNKATEHCFVWLINTSVIDLAAFVAKYRQEAAAEFDADPPDVEDKVDRDQAIEDDTAEKLTIALEDLFMEQLEEWHPESNNGFFYVGGNYQGGLDEDDLRLGLAGGAFDDVRRDVLAKALILYVKDLAAGKGTQSVPNAEMEGK